MENNLYRLRIKHNYSQKRLALEIGVTPQCIDQYENHDVMPSVKILMRIADLFNTSIDYIVGRSSIDRPIDALKEDDLNENESSLISSFRDLNITQQYNVRTTIRLFNDSNQERTFIVGNDKIK